MRQTAKLLRKTFFLNWKECLFFQILFHIFSLILFWHLGTALAVFSLRFHSYSYVTAHNIINFILSPVTLLCLVFLFFLLLILTYFQTCILMTGFQAAAAGFRIGFTQMVLGGIVRGFKHFHLCMLLKAVTPLVTFSGIANLYFIYELGFRVNPLSTFLPILFNYPSAEIVIGIIIALLAAYSFFELFYFPYLILGNNMPKTGRNNAHRLTLKHPAAILFSVLICAILLALFWHVLRWTCTFIMAALVSRFAAPDIRTALTLTLNYYVIMVSLGIAFTIGSLIYIGLITFLFYKYSEYIPGEEVIFYQRLIPPKLRRIFLSLFTASFGIGLIAYVYFGIYNNITRVERAIPFIQIAAHRGVSSQAPENTLPAIQLAIDYLADFAEIDVQCTADGEVVLFHDLNLKRVTGYNRALENTTYDKLLELDAGSSMGHAFIGTQIPTLREVMELAKGRIHLLIELKRNSASDQLVEKVLSLIEEYNMEYQCAIQSADYEYLCQVKEQNPEIATGYILSTALGNYFENDNIDFFSVRSAFVASSTVQKAHTAGKEIYAWTVNTKDEMERMKRIQVDAIITDDPILARETLYREDGDEFLARIAEGKLLQNISEE